MQRKVTIKDIAKLVGVTPATVSYVLNGNNRVGGETRNRILAAIEQLDYRPNMSARGLVKNKSFIIGLFIPKSPSVFLDPFFAELLRGITEIAVKYGYMTSIINSEGLSSVIESRHIHERVDGLIISEVKVHDAYIDYFKNVNVPFVSLGKGNNQNERDYVGSEMRKGIKVAMEYLYKLGHRRMGYVLGPLGYEYVQARYHIYREIQAQLGLDFQPAHVATGENSIEGGMAATRRILRALDTKPTAILTSTDVLALGVIEYLQSSGYKVPEDISVVGYDDSVFAKYISPSLTTVQQNVYELGRQAGIMLISKLEDLDYAIPVQVPARLIVRNSTGPVQSPRD